MEILEAYDLVGTLRGAAALAGCDHKTVGHFVALREAAGGSAPSRGRARPLVDPWVARTLAGVVLGRARALRVCGGAPPCAVPDNERAVTVDHVGGMGVGSAKIVGASRH